MRFLANIWKFAIIHICYGYLQKIKEPNDLINSRYHFELEVLSVAGKTIERFQERIVRLYEQGANINRIGQYVLKWVQWTCSGIHELHKINFLAAPEIIK